MKNLFTYPANPDTHYIDPDYYGDENSGMVKRLTELYTGNYKPWSNLTPDNSTYTTEQISKFINYLNSKKSYSNLAMYDIWRYPVVVATKKLIDSKTVQSVTQANTQPLVIVFTDLHEFTSGELVRPTGFTGSLNVLNNNNYYVDVVDTTTIRLSYNAGLTQLVSFYDLADSKGTLTSDIDVDNVVKITSSISETAGLADGTHVRLTGFDGTLSFYNNATYYIDSLDSSNFKLYFDSGLTQPFTWQELLTNQPITQINNNFATTTPIQVTLNDTVDLLDGVQITFDATSDGIQKTLSENGSFYLKSLGSKVYEVYTDGALTVALDNDLLKIWDAAGSSELTRTIPISALTPTTQPPRITTLGADLLETGDYISDVSSSVQGFNDVFNNSRWQLGTEVSPNYFEMSGDFHDKWWVTTQNVFKKPATTGQYLWPVWDDSHTINVNEQGWFTLADYSSRMVNSQVIDNGWTDVSDFGEGFIPENSLITDTGYTLSGVPLYKFLDIGANQLDCFSLTQSITPLTSYTHDGDSYAYNYQFPQSGLYAITLTSKATTKELYDYLWAKRDLTSNNFTADGAKPLLYKVNGIWNVIFPCMWGSEGSYTYVRAFHFYWDEANEKVGDEITAGSFFLGTTWLQSPMSTDRTIGSPIALSAFHNAYNYNFVIYNIDYDVPGSDLRSGDIIQMPGSIDPYTNWVVFETGVAYPTPINPYGGKTYTYFPLDNTTGQPLYNNGAWYRQFPASTTFTIYTSYSSAFGVVVPNRGKVTEARPFVRTRTISAFLERTTNPNIDGASVGRPFQDSLTGKLTEVRTSPVGETQVLDYTNTTAGYVALSTTSAYPYEIASVSIATPGNISYSYQDVTNTKIYAAQVQNTQYWKAGATTPTYYSNTGETPATFDVTVNGLGKLNSVTLVTGAGPEGRYATGDDIVLPIVSPANQYVAPVPTPAELADVWDTEDQWLNTGFDSTKEWPALWKPESASITVAQPSSTTVSQAGTKYVRQAGFTKWTLEVSYPPMPVEDFQQYHAVVQAARGQTVPFYFRLRYPDGNILWSNMDQTGLPVEVLFREDVSAGETTALIEGFAAGQTNAFKAGEVIVPSSGSDNGNLMTVLNTVNANAFGEAKIRTAYPFNTSTAGNLVYKDPYHVIVTLADDDFVYTVGTDGLYRMSVKFTLDEWK